MINLRFRSKKSSRENVNVSMQPPFDVPSPMDIVGPVALLMTAITLVMSILGDEVSRLEDVAL